MTLTARKSTERRQCASEASEFKIIEPSEENMAAVDEKVKQIIVEQLGVDEGEVTSSASFVDDLGADSLDTVELVMAFEEAFDIEIPDEDAEKIRTVQDAVDYIGKHAKAGNNLARRVVVTGLGMICDVGNSSEEVWKPCSQDEWCGSHHRFRRQQLRLPDRRRGQKLRPAELHREKGSQEDGTLHPLRHRGGG